MVRDQASVAERPIALPPVWSASMPTYQFVARLVQSQGYPEVHWERLPDERAARQLAHLLAQQYKSSGRYPGKSWMNVIDEGGTTIISIPF